MFSWDLIRNFLALHRAGTFEGAAQLLGVDHSTLRRRLQTLEQQIGRPLFARNSGTYMLMPEFGPLLEAGMAMEAASQLFTPTGLANAAAGRLRVTMLDFIASWLAPALAGFQARYPEIELDISTEHHFVDLEREQVDVAIRLARPMRGKARLRKLTDVGFSVYGAPDYLARAETGHALLVHAVHFMHHDHDLFAGGAEWTLQHLPPGRVACATDSFVTLRHYCEAGMGLALLPDLPGDAGGRLVRVRAVPEATCDLWLVVHNETGSARRVRLFLDFIVEAFKQQRSGADNVVALHPCKSV